MMIKPGISELMKDMDSRYTLAMIVAKRARELALDTATPLVKSKSDKPVTVAVEEVAAGKLESFPIDAFPMEVVEEVQEAEPVIEGIDE